MWLVRECGKYWLLYSAYRLLYSAYTYTHPRQPFPLMTVTPLISKVSLSFPHHAHSRWMSLSPYFFLVSYLAIDFNIIWNAKKTPSTLSVYIYVNTVRAKEHRRCKQRRPPIDIRALPRVIFWLVEGECTVCTEVLGDRVVIKVVNVRVLRWRMFLLAEVPVERRSKRGPAFREVKPCAVHAMHLLVACALNLCGVCDGVWCE